MKTTKKSTMDRVIVILIFIILTLSYFDFYTITITGSVIDDLSGGFCQSTEQTRNSMFSVFCTLLSFVSLIVTGKWARRLAIVAAIVNILTITVLYPFSIAAKGIIGASYSAKLTTLGWIAAGLVLLTVFILLFKECYLRQISKIEEKVGNIE